MFISHLHISSKYSRAGRVKNACLNIWIYGRARKGLDLIGTSAIFTHPAWRDRAERKSNSQEEGLYVLKDEHRLKETVSESAKPRFYYFQVKSALSTSRMVKSPQSA